MSGSSVELALFKKQLEYLFQEGNRVMTHLPTKEIDDMQHALNHMVAAMVSLEKYDDVA